MARPRTRARSSKRENACPLSDFLLVSRAIREGRRSSCQGLRRIGEQERRSLGRWPRVRHGRRYASLRTIRVGSAQNPPLLFGAKLVTYEAGRRGGGRVPR